MDLQENSLPLLTSFSHSGGAPGRGPRLRVRFRRSGQVTTIRGAFRRPNPNAEGLQVSFRRASIGGRLVGRLPYNRAVGPSPLGLMQGRPGFAANESAYLGDETTALFTEKVDPLLATLGGAA